MKWFQECEWTPALAMDASFSSEPNSSHLVSQLLLVSTLLVIPTFLIIFQVFYSKKQHRSSPQSSHHHSTAAVTPAKKKKKKKSISVKAANRQPSASTIAAGNALGNKDGEKCMEEEGDEMISTDENEQKGNNQSSFESESSHCSSSSLSSSDSEESDPTAIDKTDNDKSSDSNDQWIKVKSASNSKGRIDSDVLHNLQKQIKDLCLENERKQEAIHKLQSQLAICKSAAKNQALQMVKYRDRKLTNVHSLRLLKLHL